MYMDTPFLTLLNPLFLMCTSDKKKYHTLHRSLNEDSYQG